MNMNLMEILVNVRPEERRVVNSTSFRIDISFKTFLKVKFPIFRVRGLHECYIVSIARTEWRLGENLMYRPWRKCYSDKC